MDVVWRRLFGIFYCFPFATNWNFYCIQSKRDLLRNKRRLLMFDSGVDNDLIRFGLIQMMLSVSRYIKWNILVGNNVGIPFMEFSK